MEVEEISMIEKALPGPKRGTYNTDKYFIFYINPCTKFYAHGKKSGIDIMKTSRVIKKQQQTYEYM